MKKTIIASLIVVTVLVLGISFADKPVPDNPEDGYNGNGCPSGSHNTINIIGVNPKKDDWQGGGNGGTIFVDRTGQTCFYVQADKNFAILDHDGTDGAVGEGNNSKVEGEAEITSAGLLLPYDDTIGDGVWLVDIYVKLLGPKESTAKFQGYYMDETDTWVKISEEALNLDRNTNKFQLATGKLLADGYENLLWEFDPGTKFRHVQMRLYPRMLEE